MPCKPVFAAVFGLLALALPAAAAPGPAGCGTGSWIAGTTEICDGVLVHRDYVYDDYGAQGLSQPPSTGSLSNPTGSQSYPGPDASTVNNYADIAALRLWVDGGQLHVSFEMNSLFEAGSTVAALAIDTDGDPDNNGGAWDGLIALPDFALPLSSSGWEEIHFFTTGDPATNTLSGSIPLPPGTHWRLQAVAAVASSGVVMNAAFRGTGEAGTWFEDVQAAALQSGDISAFGHVVEVAKLQPGTTERAVLGPGYYERVYTSDYTISDDPVEGLVYDQGAEGVNYDGIPGRGASDAGAFSQAFHFVGANQPYGIYVPGTPAPHGMQLALHGFSANHTSLINQAGMQADVGQALDRILVVPLGRGPEGFYSDISERDVLDVMADVEANYDVDLERVFAGGYSMGGYGTLRLVTSYPDRFAGYLNWVGYPGDACGQPDLNRCHAGEVGIPAEKFMNLREVDGAGLYSGADELVNSAQGLWVRDQLLAAGVPHIHYYHPAADHFTYALADDWSKEAAYTLGLVRRTQPPRVTFRTEPWAEAPELNIRHDGAYWVRDIVAASGGERDYADVDLTSFGCGGEERLFEEDLPGAGPLPVPWVSSSISAVDTEPIAAENRIEGTLANVASLHVVAHTAGACLDPNQPLAYEITTDGPVEISFTGHETLALASAGTWEGTTLPEPSGALGLGAGLSLLLALKRRRRALR